MELPTPDPALLAANLALQGRRAPRAASRFASIELRDGTENAVRERRSLAWEMAAVLAVGVATLVGVTGLWLY
jgi:hypothetical protein